MKIYIHLKNMYGSQDNWWPGETPFHIALGAILTQNTSWKQAYKALKNLISNNLDTPRAISETDIDKLKHLIKPAGFMNQKAIYIKELSKHVCEELYCDITNLKELPDPRTWLLNIKGIGKETADSILLYGLNMPYFVTDSYTKRLLLRLGIIETTENYDRIAEIFLSNLPKEPNIFKEYHALIVEHAKQKCKKKKPLCEQCILRDLCHLQKKASHHRQDK